jgi:broad specificity phosphatase PhoE
VAEASPAAVLIRHGPTALNNPPERVRSWSQEPLSPKGTQVCTELARKIAEQFDPSQIFTSDLPAASQCTDILLKELGRIPFYKAKELRSWNVGIYTGQPVAKVQETLDTYIEKPDEAPKGGESFNAFSKRLLGFVQPALEKARGKAGNPVLLVTHTRCIRRILAWLYPERAEKILSDVADPVEPGEFIPLAWDGKNWQAQGLTLRKQEGAVGAS